MEINFNDLECVEFVLENCECVSVPIGCFEQLELLTSEEINLDRNIKELWLESLKCKIRNYDNIRYSTWSDVKQNPIERLSFDDISQIILIYKNNNKQSIYIDWFEENEWNNHESNEYQLSELISYNIIHISISKDNKTYTMQEIFDLPYNTKFKDENNDIYFINTKGELNKPLTKTILSASFWKAS